MADFNNTNLADFSGVWVFCEQRQGELQPTVLELISEARKLADDMGTEVCGLLLGGKGVGEKMAKELGAYGADKVLVCESDLLDTYTTDAYAKVLCDTVMAKKPEILLIAATNIGRDLGPRCAARLHTGLTADCTHLDVDVEKYAAFLQDASTLPQAQIDALNREDRNLKMTRPAQSRFPRTSMRASTAPKRNTPIICSLPPCGTRSTRGTHIGTIIRWILQKCRKAHSILSASRTLHP